MSIRELEDKSTLSGSRRQTINTKMVDRKNMVKRLIKNWRLISLLKFYMTILSKALSKSLKIVILPIKSKVNLLADIIYICDTQNLNEHLVILDTRKKISSTSSIFLKKELIWSKFHHLGRKNFERSSF